MRKVVGIGETVLDIVFKDNRPLAAIPGGSVFNSMVSLSRAGIPASFISELGDDRVANLISRFMRDNGLTTDYIDFYTDGDSPVALAFLDENRNAAYQFYRRFPGVRMNKEFPVVNCNDICLFSSYFAVNPDVRTSVLRLLDTAEENRALLYYDINFRKPHAAGRDLLMPSVIENFRFADIIRASHEDLEVLFGSASPYFYPDGEKCKVFIITQGESSIFLQTPVLRKEYPIKVIKPVSTIGAGDAFNAGLVYGLMELNVTKEKLPRMEECVWDRLIEYAKLFAADVCASYNNYISYPFTRSLKQ